MNKEQTIDLPPPQNKILQKILRQQIPNKTVWAFGSRVEWRASETSDLDLVAHKCSGAEIADLKEALEESALHCSVDVLNWEDIPDSFRANIKKHYVVVQQNTVPEGWRVVKLGSVMHIFTGRKNVNQTKENGAYRFFSCSSDKYYSDEYICDDDALIITGNGAYTGTVQFFSGKFDLYQRTYACVLNEKMKKHFDSKFLYYYVKKRFESIYMGGSRGSTIPYIVKGDIENFLVPNPPLPEQKAIAEVLSSLDDKIDLLRKQNKTLEDMAQTLFCKWFMGGLSDRWEIKALDEIADYLNGLACQKHPPQNDKDKLPVLKIRELKNGISENSDWATSAVDDKYIINLGDIVFSWSGSLMVKLWDGEKCVLNQHLFKVSSECYPNWYIYFWTKHYISKFIQIADSKATTMGHIKREDLSSSMVKVPKPDELSAMNKKILPQFQKMVLNYKQIRALEELRDMLLSRLIAGEVRI